MSELTTVYLALGSNVGDRMANLKGACDLLERAGLEIQARSGVYETQSVEGGGDTNFLNAALRAGTLLSPEELLKLTQGIEAGMGRAQPPRVGPRAIDIDILFFGELNIDSGELQVPHPRMGRRAFVLRPLCDVLEGGWVVPSREKW